MAFLHKFSDVRSSSPPVRTQLPSLAPSVYPSRWLQPQQRGKRRPSIALTPLHLERGRYMVSKVRVHGNHNCNRDTQCSRHSLSCFAVMSEVHLLTCRPQIVCLHSAASAPS